MERITKIEKARKLLAEAQEGSPIDPIGLLNAAQELLVGIIAFKGQDIEQDVIWLWNEISKARQRHMS
jgi:hypothetical protein